MSLQLDEFSCIVSEHPHHSVRKFFHFTHLKPTFSILYTYFYKTLTSVRLLYTFIQIKYSFFSHSHLSHRHNTIHTATIIQPPATVIKPHNNPTTIPFNQATINEIHIPIQPRHHQLASKNPNPKIYHHPTQSPSLSHTTKIQRSNHHHQPTQIQRFKIPKPTRNKEKPSAMTVQQDRRLPLSGRGSCIKAQVHLNQIPVQPSSDRHS